MCCCSPDVVSPHHSEEGVAPLLLPRRSARRTTVVHRTECGHEKSQPREGLASGEANCGLRRESAYFFASGGVTGAAWPATNGYFTKIAATASLIVCSLFSSIFDVTTPS